jgi:hypothetical protein
MIKTLTSIALAVMLSVTAVTAKDHKTGSDSPGNSGENGNGVSGTSGNQGNGKGNGNAGGKKGVVDPGTVIVTDDGLVLWVGRCYTDGRVTVVFDGATGRDPLPNPRRLPELTLASCVDWLKRIEYLDDNGVKK